uniref:Small capsomere-interacting protein n=1 Tax=Steinernema glaseri TaxID=37863 RepID=A0A1I7Y1H3_9BILA
MSGDQPSTSTMTPATQKTSKKRQPMVSDANERINFLHQAASLLAATTDSQSSSAAKLARIYLTDMNEVNFIGMTRMDRAIRRSYCKKSEARKKPKTTPNMSKL